MLQGTLLPAQRAASADDIRHNLARVQDQIGQTCQRCGRGQHSLLGELSDDPCVLLARRWNVTPAAFLTPG